MKNSIVIFLISLLLFSCEDAPVTNLLQGKTGQEEISVVGKMAGRIDTIWVKEGDKVKKGDTLAILNIPEINAKRKQALGALESAEAQYQMSATGATQNQLRQLQAKKSALTEQYEFAKKSLDRLENMLRDSLIPQQTYDETFAKFQGASAQLDAVKAEIADVENGVRLEQQIMALGQKNRALGALHEVDIAEEERYILAPADMTIETITVHAGELALPGYTLFKGPLPQSTYFRFTLPENRLNEIQKEQKLNIHVGYSNQKIEGIIKTINPLSSYADISTAYPDYEVHQSLFEIKIIPVDPSISNEVIPNTVVTLDL